MTKNILQISPFAFDHLGGVEKYAEVLQEIFPVNAPLGRGEDMQTTSESEAEAYQGGGSEDFSGKNFDLKNPTKISTNTSPQKYLHTKNTPLPPFEGGLDWEISTLCGGKDFSIFEPVKNCPVPKIWQKDFWKIFSEISAENTKIIISHIRFAPTAWLAFWLAKRQKIPYIHIEHGTGFLVHKNFFIRNIAKIVDLTIGKYILKNADFVITISKAWENWVKNFSGRREKIETIYRGFTPHPSPLLQGEGDSKQENLKIPPRPVEEGARGWGIVKLWFVGRLTSLKNLNILIESLKNLQNLNWKCEIVGDGEMRSEWENLVKKYHLEEKIVFLGAQENAWILENFYPKIDIFINPSLQEWLPTTVIEAKISGCEVLATDVGGTSEIPDISLCQPTEFSLTKNLEKMIKNFQKNPKKTELSESFLEQFSLSKMKENFEKIFNLF